MANILWFRFSCSRPSTLPCQNKSHFVKANSFLSILEELDLLFLQIFSILCIPDAVRCISFCWYFRFFQQVSFNRSIADTGINYHIFTARSLTLNRGDQFTSYCTLASLIIDTEDLLGAFENCQNIVSEHCLLACVWEVIMLPPKVMIYLCRSLIYHSNIFSFAIIAKLRIYGGKSQNSIFYKYFRSIQISAFVLTVNFLITSSPFWCKYIQKVCYSSIYFYLL